MKIQRYRDLSLLYLDEQKILVTACDSCGAVGMKPHDMLFSTPEVTGALTARVALMEVMCTGAKVQCIYNTLSCEMHPTGERIIAGIHSELEKAGLDAELLSGSTEENFQTLMTATGVVAIGLCEEKPRLGEVKAGNVAVLIARPKSGAQIKQPVDDDLVSYEEIKTLLQMEGVREIVPCGSKGVLYEAKQIAECSDLKFVTTESDDELLHASAGTATCAVVAIDRGHIETLISSIGADRARTIGFYEES